MVSLLCWVIRGSIDRVVVLSMSIYIKLNAYMYARESSILSGAGMCPGCLFGLTVFNKMSPPLNLACRDIAYIGWNLQQANDLKKKVVHISMHHREVILL